MPIVHDFHIGVDITLQVSPHLRASGCDCERHNVEMVCNGRPTRARSLSTKMTPAYPVTVKILGGEAMRIPYVLVSASRNIAQVCVCACMCVCVCARELRWDGNDDVERNSRGEARA